MDDAPEALRDPGREEELAATQHGRCAAARCLASMAAVDGALEMLEEDSMLGRMMDFLNTCDPELLESVLHVITGMLSVTKRRTKLAQVRPRRPAGAQPVGKETGTAVGFEQSPGQAHGQG